MRSFRVALIIFSVYLLQTIIASRFPVFGVRVDLLLVFTTLFAVYYGPEQGFMAGLICGITQDIFGTGPFFNAISKSLMGFLVGTFKESVLGTEEAVAVTAVAVATITNFILELMIMFFFFGKPLASIGVLFATLLLSCLYNSALAPVMYMLIKALPGLAAE